MVRPQQYKFPPPPLPPAPSSSYSHVQQYGYPQQTPNSPQHQQRGGGINRGGRGSNHNNRSETHGSNSQNITHHLSGGYDPRQPQQPQTSFPPSRYNSSLNTAQMSAPYIGPQPGPPTQQGYSSTRWQNNQHGPVQPQQPHMFYSSQPTPLSVQNYHPNYAPQTYQQPHYSTSQPPFQAQPPSYGHSVPPNQPPHVPPQTVPQQWQGTPQHIRPPFTGHRGRGGFSNSGRVTHDSPALLMGPPIRMGFDNDRGGSHMAQASNGFTHSHISHHPPATFPQPPFHSYPPQDFSQAIQRLPGDTNQYSSPHKSRGGSMNFKGKGRIDSHQSHSRNRTENRHHQSSGPKSTNENYPKVYGADSTSKKKKKKRKTNTLGLTPNGAEHEDSEDEVDDIDEEARLVTLLGADTPQLPTDLEVWLAERKRKFPTKSRREAAIEQSRLRREEAHENKHKKPNSEKFIKKEGETKLEKQQRKAEKLRLELEKAERKIQQEISGSKRKRDNGDEGDDDRGQVSDNDSESSSSLDSDDKPETLSTRANSSSRLHPPKAQLQRHCKYFSTGGTCGKKGKCRFLHDHEVRNQALRDKEANGGKMTLAQRLILNDTAKDDLTILKSIKYLKEKGLMPDQLTGSTSQYGDESRVKDSENDDEDHSHCGD